MSIAQVSHGFASRFAPLDTQAYVESLKHPPLLQLVLSIVFVAGAIALTSAGVAVYRASEALHLAIASTPVRADPALAPTMPRPSSVEGDFVSELPATPPTNLQIRFAAKIAHEQDVTVVQMQSEPLKSGSSAIGQSRITLQLRGDYRDIKNVWIAMLSKYPGLTLQRLTIRHHADTVVAPSPAGTTTPLPPADRADDEASIEMIQYTQAAATVR